MCETGSGGDETVGVLGVLRALSYELPALFSCSYWSSTNSYRSFLCKLHCPGLKSGAGLVKVFYKLRLLTRPMAKFVHHHIDNGVERHILYERWTVLHDFSPDISKIKQIIREYNIPVNLLFGEYDRVIKVSQGLSFGKDEPLITVMEVKSGHQLLKEHLAEDVANLLL